jgi:hypothetical protein
MGTLGFSYFLAVLHVTFRRRRLRNNNKHRDGDDSSRGLVLLLLKKTDQSDRLVVDCLLWRPRIEREAADGEVFVGFTFWFIHLLEKKQR